MRFELTPRGFAILHIDRFAKRALERAKGIEPLYSAWKAAT